jgi:Undecaprenyl-phosphate glucose phosphotransferase
MLRIRYQLINAGLICFDLTLTAACLFMAFRWEGTEGGAGPAGYPFLSPAVLVLSTVLNAGWFCVLSYGGLYQSRRVDSVFSDSPILFKASAIGLFITESASRWLPAPFSSIYFLLRFFLTTLVVLVVARALLRLLLRLLRGYGLNTKNLLIVASRESGDRISEKITRREDYGYQIVDRLDCPNTPTSSTDSLLEEFRAILRSQKIDDVILALPGNNRKLELDLIDECESLAINVRVVPDLLPLIQTSTQFFNLDGIPLISVQPYRTEDLRYIVGKRLFDIAFSLFAIVVLFPVYLLIAILVKVTSEGPILVIQERVGLNARKFRMYKFRTMFSQAALEAEIHWTTAGDTRVTPLGRWLRGSNLDELPQFFNVLKGEMSIVGPRPERPHFINLFQKEIPGYMRRHYAKCGMTGWAQVNGWRGDTSIQQRVTHDLYYIRHWAFGFDLKIILLTLTRSFFHRNAY